ncbi:MAG: hypothetical protein ACR2RV_27035 [Verrucomicrobiales bacterium]
MIKKFFSKKFVRWSAWLIALGFSLLVLFHMVENYRGAKAWEETVEMLEAGGETVDFDELLPDPLPDEENFGAIPVLKGIMVVVDGDPAKGSPGEKRERIQAFGKKVFGSPPVDPPALSTSPVTTDDKFDLDGWATYFREHTDLVGADDATIPAGEVILAALGEFDPVFDELTAAVDLPYARFSPGLEQHRGAEDPFMISLPHLSALQALSKLLVLRAHAQIALGQPEQAVETIQAGLRVAELSGDGGMLIGTLVHVAQINMLMSPVWLALEGRLLGADELEELQRRLEGLDPIGSFRDGIRLELAGAARNLGTAKARGGVAEFVRMVSSSSGGGGGGGMALLARLAPKGWIDQNRATLARMHWEFELEPLKHGGVLQVKDKMEELLALQKQRAGFPSPYKFLAHMTMPSMAMAFQRIAQVQVFLDLQIGAIALERYYIQNGEYPESLDALVPEFLEEVPRDIVADAPLHYKRTGDGRYQIYSIGWDGTDGGGEVSIKDNGSIDRLAGDWVWQYQAAGGQAQPGPPEDDSK